ncbi:MAG: glycosyltransferase family 8 protein [Candidatus Gastranaerophilales bacterium]|nr:glycosyltransferase family 8 protein [Candidatus Gastranaerophilales bacterium]
MNNNLGMNIFFSSDDNYARHLTVSIASILYNADKNDKFNFYILDGGISDKSKKYIEKLKKIKKFNIKYIVLNDKMFEKCPLKEECKHISKPTYYRYIIPTINPDIEKCLYLDCDIVVNAPLDEFYNMDFEDNYAVVVEDMFTVAKEDKIRLDVDTYFNAGVMLINNKKWIEDDITNKLFENTSKLINLIRWVDQDILNYTFNKKIKLVHPKYNCQTWVFKEVLSDVYSDKELEEGFSNPVIIHYSSDTKPWNGGRVPYASEYFKYLKMTSYKKDYYKQKIDKLLKAIFSIQKDDFYKAITLFGVKFKFIRKNHILRQAFYKQEEIRSEVEKINSNICKKNEEAFMAYNLHKEVFPKYKGINKGRDVVVVATGPSLKNFKPIENACYIGVNRAFEYDRAKFDYLFLQDYSGPTRTYIDKFIKYDAHKFLGILPEKCGLNTIIPLYYGDFDDVERYYTVHPTEKQEFAFDLASLALGDSYSVVFPAMQFALWTRPKRIYIVGCDCTMSGHYNGKSNILAVNAVIDGWRRMKKFANAYYPDTEIISINPVGLKGIFRDEYQKEIVKAN